jgi:hypothetical protein
VTSISVSFRRLNRRAVSAGTELRMAQTAWVTMTRGEAERQPPSTARPRVDAGVKS